MKKIHKLIIPQRVALDKSALIYLDSASLVTYDLSIYKKNKRKKIKTNGADEYLTDLITQYKEFIKKENEVIINEE